jgi:predicted AlkP superfamily pyrophosphatase or phosphodiesterase
MTRICKIQVQGHGYEIFFRLMAALFLLQVTLAVPVAARGKASERIPTILISIDGFRPDYISPTLTPNLAAIAARACRAR